MSSDFDFNQFVNETSKSIGAKVKVEQLKAILREHEQSLPLLLELAAANARIKRAHYEALVGEGFKPEEALLLIK
jgi:hypothetical protein